jgi:hypothetical protein
MTWLRILTSAREAFYRQFNSKEEIYVSVVINGFVHWSTESLEHC